MKSAIYNILIFILLYSASTFASSTPCDGLKLRLVGDYKKKLELPISKQLNVRTVEVMEEFSLSNWYVVHVKPHEAEEVFLFYTSEPLNNKYINLWGGIAKQIEEN